MNIEKLSIRGKNVGKLIPWILKDFQEITRYASGSGEIRIFGNETYFFRIKSNLCTMVMLDLRTQYRCHVVIVSGGGSVGILPAVTWGAESSANAAFIGSLKAVCCEYSLKIEETQAFVPAGMDSGNSGYPPG